MDKTVRTHLQKLKELAAPELYVVGGTVRDRLLGKPSADYDFTCPNAPRLARAFATQTKLPLVPLDDTPGRETFRVVITKQVYFDFSQMQGNSIQDDLSRRDFSFNALAISLPDFLEEKQTHLDPHHGAEDLRNRIVRVLPGPIFSDDPLRMLRAFRFAGTLKFTIENETLEKIARFKSQITRVAAERIYYELSLFLEAGDTHPLLVSMDQTGFLEYLIPEITSLRSIHGEKTEVTVWQQTLQTFQNIDTLISQSTRSPGLLSGMVQSLGHKELFLVKMATLLHRLRDSTLILKRLRASNRETTFVDKTIKYQEEALIGIEGFAGTQCIESLVYRFVKQCGKELIPALLLSMASHCSRNGISKLLANPFAQAALKVYDFYIRKYLPAQERPALLSGDDIIKQFNLPPSPLFKTILDQVEENRVLGIIKTRREAEALAETLINAR